MFDMPRIPLGRWVEDFVDFLLGNFGWLFGAIRTGVLALVGAMETVLFVLPVVLFALLAAVVAWRLRGWGFAAFTLFGFLLIDAFNQWDRMIETLALVVVATVLAIAVGVPVGIASARKPLVRTIVRPVLDFMQTMPAFVYLIPAIMFFSIGRVPGLVATFIFAMPPGVRFTELGIRQVDREVVEAATAFGASEMQTLTRVQIPLAMPTIMGGINQVIMLALSMVVIAGMVGAGGLGSEVFRAIQRINVGLGFEAGTAVVVVAIYLDRVTAALGSRDAARISGTA